MCLCVCTFCKNSSGPWYMHACNYRYIGVCLFVLLARPYISVDFPSNSGRGTLNKFCHEKSCMESPQKFIPVCVCLVCATYAQTSLHLAAAMLLKVTSLGNNKNKMCHAESNSPPRKTKRTDKLVKKKLQNHR